ncbi:helix-turn-helix domain-containing protein [Amycolatopsis magusensis]|uniref:helix-turn-helix domain-containing protein n=1 Tax=Amycolatopsis magusensis TaxID=882444 RepID=UPI0037A60B15
MSETNAVFPHIDQNVATNLRAFRERGGVSQEELAQRMSERGFGFSQATIWKIESGQRPVKISEAVALSDALDLPSWINLTAEPDVTRHHADLTAAHRGAAQTYAVLKDAAVLYLRAQVDLSFIVRQARDAGVPVSQLYTSWLDIPAEKAVLEARVESAHEDDVQMRQAEEVNAILAALREHGYVPPRPEDWVEDGGESATGSVDDAGQAEPAGSTTEVSR